MRLLTGFWPVFFFIYITLERNPCQPGNNWRVLDINELVMIFAKKTHDEPASGVGIHMLEVFTFLVQNFLKIGSFVLRHSKMQ